MKLCIVTLEETFSFAQEKKEITLTDKQIEAFRIAQKNETIVHTSFSDSVHMNWIVKNIVTP